MQFLYHLGVHKTGTTLLQQNLCANAGALRAQGVYCLNAEWEDGLKRLRRRLRRIQKGAAIDGSVGSFEGVAELNQRILRRAAAAGATRVLVSEENLLGVTLHRQMAWSAAPARLYPTAEPCARALTTGLDPGAVHVLIHTRRLEGLLRGFYSEALRHLETDADFAGFLDRVDIAGFRFDALVAGLKAALPGARITARPFEAIRGGADPFLRGALGALGIDAAPLAISAQPVRAGLSHEQAVRLRDIAARATETGLTRKLSRAAARIVADRSGPSGRIEVPARYRALIAAAQCGDLSERLLAGTAT